MSFPNELSHFTGESPDPKDKNGIYRYPYLDAYWQETERFPYLLFSDAKLAGFALVRKSGAHWEIAEFYVKPEFRRRGLGMTCATKILNRHPGAWRIGFNKQNQASRNLWRKLSEHLSHGSIEDGESDGSHDCIQFSI